MDFFSRLFSNGVMASGLISAVVGFVLIGFWYALSARDLEWSSSKIVGQVIDADSHAPLVGVIVTANWQLRAEKEGAPRGQLAALEVVTDADGRFEIPAWSGKRSPRNLLLYCDEPTIRFFLRGYTPVVSYARIQGCTYVRLNEIVDINSMLPQVISMGLYKGDSEGYMTRLEAFQFSLDSMVFDDDCVLGKFPLTYIELQKLKTEYRKTEGASRLLAIDDLIAVPKCKMYKKHFEGYIK